MPGLYTRRSIALGLFELESDRDETIDVAAQHPDVVKRLIALADAARVERGDTATSQTGRVREPGRLP